jgi:hypothetical protein
MTVDLETRVSQLEGTIAFEGRISQLESTVAELDKPKDQSIALRIVILGTSGATAFAWQQCRDRLFCLEALN